MSTPIHATDVAAFDRELNHMILKGQIRDAFEKFYAGDVVMQENLTTPRVGKAANRKAEQDFVGSIEPFHGAALLGSSVNGDRSYSKWEFDATYQGGHRVKLTQVAVRQSKNGQIAHERFYYSK
jgi:ketosteroid isomerase-like protein